MQVSYTHINETVQSDLLTARKTRLFSNFFFCVEVTIVAKTTVPLFKNTHQLNF